MQQLYDGKAAHGSVYMALCQTNGKGQRGKHWYTGKNNNLALSVVIEPSFLTLNNAFMLHTFVCVSLVQYLNTISKGFSIKWPNDIYYNDNKTAGVLIENSIQGSNWKYAVVGIGLNVNDNNLASNVAKAISLQQITNQRFELTTIAQGIMDQMQLNWAAFKEDFTSFYELYNSFLYKKGAQIVLKKGEETITTVLKNVSENGKLVCGQNAEIEFNHGEVEWVIS
jgi:BirA family transcriptional regulator, biotin operon repressor / biotin---[acetyl-CoA-carboxylase] ligase